MAGAASFTNHELRGLQLGLEIPAAWPRGRTFCFTSAAPGSGSPWIAAPAAEDRALLHLARIAGHSVGYALTVLHPGSDDTFPLGAGYAELYTLAVLPEVRGSGIGTALLDVVDAALADAAIPNLTVAAMAQNDAVIRLYRRRGLVPRELIMYRIGGGMSPPPHR